MSNETNYVALINIEHKGEDVYFVLMADKGEDGKYPVLGFLSEEEGLHCFEGGYDESHLRSYEGSMSACVNWMFFHPSIIKVEDGIEGLKKLVGENPKMWSYNSIAGHYKGIPIEPKMGKILWERGAKPSIWDKDRFHKIVERENVKERLQKGESE